MNQTSNALYEWTARIANCIMVSMLWLLCDIPIITIGASTAALYRTVHLSICHERQSVWETFFPTFKECFKKCTKYWIVLLLLLVFFAFDWCVTYILGAAGSPLGGLNLFCVIMLALVALWAVYTFAFLSRFPYEKKHVLKNSFIMTIHNLPRSLLIVLAVIIGAFIVSWRAIAVALVPGVIGVLVEKMLEPVFYQIMTPEERQREDEEQKEEEEANRDQGGMMY